MRDIMTQNSKLIIELFDEPIIKQLDIDPSGILMIPKDCYDRIMEYYVDNELYEKCIMLEGQKHKVYKSTITEMLAEYCREKCTSLNTSSEQQVTALLHILMLLSISKNKK